MNNKPGLTFRELRQRREEAPLPKPPPVPEPEDLIAKLFQARDQVPPAPTPAPAPRNTPFRIPVAAVAPVNTDDQPTRVIPRGRPAQKPATPKAARVPTPARSPGPRQESPIRVAKPASSCPLPEPPPPAVKTAADRAAAPVTPKISVPRRQFSFLSITELAIARWPSILLLTSVWMLGALVLSWGFCETRYTATVQLAREAATDFETQPPALTPRAFARLVRSQGVLERVSQRVAPALDAAALANNVKVATDSRNERVTLTVAGDSPDQAVALANLYARELLVAQRSAAAAAMTARPLATGAEPDNAGTPAEVLPGRYRVSAPAKEVVVHNRWLRIAGWTALGLLAGLIFSLPITIVSEFLDDRLKTAADVARVTGLPILGSMGNLFQMLPTERNTHGSRLWRALRIRLADAPENGALICGVASSGELEGKTTLIRLLGQTACQHGYRVKVIHLRPPRPGTRPSHTTVDESLTQVEELAAPNAIAHLKRAGCTLDQMVAFERALGELRKIPRLLVLVELPSAEIPEAVTAAEKLPNLLWVADCNRVHAASTKTQLESLRQAQCRIVGAVLNHEPQAFLRDRFPRWFSAS